MMCKQCGTKVLLVFTKISTLSGKTRKDNRPQTAALQSDVTDSVEEALPGVGVQWSVRYSRERPKGSWSIRARDLALWWENTLDLFLFKIYELPIFHRTRDGLQYKTEMRWRRTKHLQGIQGRLQMLTIAELLLGQRRWIWRDRLVSEWDRSFAPGFILFWRHKGCDREGSRISEWEMGVYS